MNVAGIFTQTQANGMTFTYDASGYLSSMADRAGNTLTITRNGFHNITQIVDTQDRLYTVTYTDGTAAQKVASLTDFAGRQIVYSYDGNGDLVRVRSPSVTGTLNGNDFPAGKTTLYTYSSGLPDLRLNHNLLTVVDPAYNVANNPAPPSKPWVTLTYATTLDPLQPDFDRVVTERWGHDQGGPPTNPNIVVGGTSTFSYSTNLTGDAFAPPNAASRVTETDRNGNIIVHYFDFGLHEIRRQDFTNREVRPGEGNYTTNYTYTGEGLLASRTLPRGNAVTFAYDQANPSRRSQGNLLEVRLQANGIGGGGSDLVTRYTYEPVYNQLRTTTDPRAFPTGSVPLDGNGHLNLADLVVARYTTTHFFDYQEGTGFQTSKGVPVSEQIAEGLGDQNGAVDFTEGNIVKVAYPTIQTPGPNNGQVITELLAWNDRGQVLTRTDPEGHVTEHEYYATNGIPNDPTDLEGYEKSVTQDKGDLSHFNLRTLYGYDAAGNLTAVTDPKGETTDLSINALNQVVRTLSRTVFGTTRYQVDTFYDANDNVVRHERQNFKDDGTLYAHNPLVATFEHDVLRFPVAEIRDKSLNDNSQTGTVRTEYLYDPNMNRTAVRLPLAVTGLQPNNVITILRDERNLPYRVTRGDNDTNPANTPPGNAVVATTNYDPNGNVLETIDSIRNAQRPEAPTTEFPGSAPGDVTKRQYDGFDRLVEVVDGEGNEHETNYDLASNRVQAALRGRLDHTAGAAIALLEETDATFDEMNRVVQTDTRHFDTKTGASVGDGHQFTAFTHDRDGKRTLVTDDRGLETTFEWDTADRRLRVIDDLGNEVEYGYDDNSNVITVTRRDLSSDLGSINDVFTTTMTYDGIDRLVVVVDPVGDVEEYFYDSRDNVVRTSDGVRGAGHPGGPGNIVRMEYDGLDRLVRTERILTDSGRGDSMQSGVITTLQAWDDDSRLISQTDDNGHATAYGYDALNRLTTITYADMTTRTTAFDTDDHLTVWTDQNGTQADMTHDGLDRLLSRSVAPGPGVIGSTSETFGYDGASRVTLAQNNDGINPGMMDCLFEYDSLSNRTKDQQATLAVDSLYDAVSNRTQITYPGRFGGGRRTLTLAYDDLNRFRSISDSETIATMHYRGSSRLERRNYGVDASPVSKLDVAYDALPRVTLMDHTLGGGAQIARFEYGHDRAHHRLYEKRVHDGSLGDVYRYDSIYRVTRDSQDINLSGLAPGTEIDPNLPAYSLSPDRLEYTYDGVGNRTMSAEVVSNASTVTTYTQTAGGAVQDAEVNQYTSTQVGAMPLRNYGYDSNGNLIADDEKTYGYDFKNRLVEVRDAGTTSLLGRYSYDALGRRYLVETLSSGTRYLFDGLEVIEERDELNSIKRQYVWGAELDELLQEKTIDATYFAHEAASASIAALVDSGGTVVERYEYDPFGVTTVSLDGMTDNKYGFHGAYSDGESGLYFMRRRTYSPSLGRFLQRDPVGVWTDGLNLGNGSLPSKLRMRLAAAAALKPDGPPEVR